MIQFEELEEAMRNSCINCSGSLNRIHFRSPGDAFLALVHLRLEVNSEVNELGLQDIINDVRNPHFRAFEKRRWEILFYKLSQSDGRNASLIPDLTSGSFFASRTFTRISDIDNFIRESQEQSIQPYHEATYMLPSLVLHLIADFKAGEVDDFMHTMLRLPSRRTPQQDLLSMSLVHKSWTFLFQSRARRIVHLSSHVSLQKFIQNPHCGPWIREFYYRPQQPAIPKRKLEFFTEDEEGFLFGSHISDRPLQLELVNHWPLLASFLSLRLPHLRFLSISFSDIQRTVDSQGNLMNPRPHRGFAGVVRCIGKITQLEGLEIDLHDSLFHPHLFPNLCAELAGLQRLRALSIRGFETRTRWPSGSIKDDVQDRIPHWILPQWHSEGPRLQLQTLELNLLGTTGGEYDRSGLLWILQSLPTLENVIISVWQERTGTLVQEQVAALRDMMQSTLDEPFPRLRSLRVQIGGEDFTIKFNNASYVEIVAGRLLRRCTSLKTFFVTFSPTPTLRIPPTVEILYLSFNFTVGKFSASIWSHWDSRTVALLETRVSSHNALKLVVIDLNCEEYGFELRSRFPQTIAVCEKHLLSLEFSDEGAMSFNQRMYNSTTNSSVGSN